MLVLERHHMFHFKKSLVLMTLSAFCAILCLDASEPIITADSFEDTTAAATAAIEANGDLATTSKQSPFTTEADSSALTITGAAYEMNAFQGWISTIQRRPILEILYAWLGYDQWESYGASYHIRTKYNAARMRTDRFPTFDKNWQPITTSIAQQSFSDITPQLQQALERGTTTSINNRQAQWPGSLYIRREKPTVIAAKSHNGYMHPENIAGYSFNSNPGHGVIASKESLISSNTLDDPRTVGIVYRDADGIHFRRFEGWQNIVLPMVSSIQVGSSGKSLNFNSAFFYGHQFEEIGRGLITATVKTTGSLNFLALDRFGWGTTFNDGTTFCPGVYAPLDAAGNDFYYMVKPDGKSWFDSSKSLNLFRFNWGTKGSTLDLKGSGFAVFPDNDQHARLKYRTSIPDYKYYNEKGFLISLPAPTNPASASNADPSINADQPAALPFPGASGREIDIWAAFDKNETGTLFTIGTGAPDSEADFFNDAKEVRILYKKNVVTSPYLRYFGFSPDNTTASLYNIKSKRLNKKQKFCTPPFSRGKFLFWQREWEAPTPDAFSVSFSARGHSVQVGLSSLDTTARATTSTSFDTSYNYAIRFSTQSTTTLASPLVIEKCKPKNLSVASQTRNNIFQAAEQEPTQLTVKNISSLPEIDIETYQDYWIIYNNGVIEVGLGKTPGKQIVGVAYDPDAKSGICSYCFSGDMYPTDYCNINSQTYYIPQSVSEPGAYTEWLPIQQFDTKGRGAILFSYQNNPSNSTAEKNSNTGAKSVEDQSSTVMIGLNNNIPKDRTTPYYQIKLGTTGNTSHQILIQSNIAKSTQMPQQKNGTASPVVNMESSWHKMWLMYELGLIAYGTGDVIGRNVLCIWQDPVALIPKPSPPKGIDSFCFTSLSPSMTFAFQSQPPLPSYKTYRAEANAQPFWHPLWQSLTPNQGGFIFSVTGNPTSILQIGWVDNSLPITSPFCECIINDKGNAYMRQAGTIQETSIATLTRKQIPSSKPIPYWVAWDNGLYVLGSGTDPLNADSVITKWQDPDNSTAITRFVLSSQNSAANYSNIALLDHTAYALTINALRTTTIAPSTATIISPQPAESDPTTGTATSSPTSAPRTSSSASKIVSPDTPATESTDTSA